jgi:hypothetical protein
VGDLALLIGAITGLVAAVGTATTGVIIALRASPRERQQAARGALELLAEAAQDGVITPEELKAVLDEERGDER